MPNIEIHGVDQRTAATVSQLIKSFLEHEEYASELVVTSYVTSARDLQGLAQPYLRIAAPKDSLDKHLGGMVPRLRRLNLDIEVLELRAFIPKS